MSGLSNKNKSQYHHLAWLHGIEVLEASFTDQAFGRHAHEEFAVGAISEGVAGNDCRGERTLLPTGSLSLLNPEEPHTGFMATGLLRYNMLYASEYAVRSVLGVRTLRGFKDVAPMDRGFHVSRALSQLVASLRQPKRGAWKLRIEEAVSDVLAASFVTYGRAHLRSVGDERGAVAIIKERIVDGVETDADLSLSELAEIAQLSKSYLIRATRRATGLTPHGLVLKARIEKAHRLLLAKTPAAEAAIAAGFYDQAHLIRQYRRHFGVTPGAVLRHL